MRLRSNAEKNKTRHNLTQLQRERREGGRQSGLGSNSKKTVGFDERWGLLRILGRGAASLRAPSTSIQCDGRPGVHLSELPHARPGWRRFASRAAAARARHILEAQDGELVAHGDRT